MLNELCLIAVQRVPLDREDILETTSRWGSCRFAAMAALAIGQFALSQIATAIMVSSKSRETYRGYRQAHVQIRPDGRRTHSGDWRRQWPWQGNGGRLSQARRRSSYMRPARAGLRGDGAGTETVFYVLITPLSVLP